MRSVIGDGVARMGDGVKARRLKRLAGNAAHRAPIESIFSIAAHFFAPWHGRRHDWAVARMPPYSQPHLHINALMPSRPAAAHLVGLCLLATTTFVAPVYGQEPAQVPALLARGDHAAALQLAQEAAAARPADASLRFVLGVALMDMGRDEQALKVFTELSQTFPELPDPMNNIALLQARAGQLEPARQSLEVALRNDPAHQAARTNLGQVHLMLAAQAWAQAAAAMPGDNPLLQKLLGVRALLAAPSR